MIDGNGSNERAEVREFTKCPACGSEERVFEQMGKELKEKGLALSDMQFYYDVRRGTLVKPEKLALLPIGTDVPAYAIASDVCKGCGCIYIVKLETAKARKSLAPVTLMPNRAQRRAGLQGRQHFPIPPGNI